MKSGAPGGIRTPDLLVRSQTLYPAELRAHCLLSLVFSIAYAATSSSSPEEMLEHFRAGTHRWPPPRSRLSRRDGTDVSVGALADVARLHFFIAQLRLEVGSDD
jgi:hypothetical protein